MYISIIVPIYNENLIIKKNLTKIYNCFKNKFEFEIILVNDGSTDNSLNEVEKTNIKNIKIINNLKNMGKGYSIINGIKNSKGNIILVTDADLSTPIEEFFKLYKLYKQGKDCIIGSRSNFDSNVKLKQGTLRIITGKIFNILVKLILNLDYNDTQCGFKLYNGDKIRNIINLCKVRGFCIDVEILYLFKIFNFKVLEKGVVWLDDSRSTVNLYKDPFNMFVDLIKIKMRKY